jgi:predicted nucleic acid-binding protein
MKLYLDICCFNRPFDDQSDIRIRLEAEAKLAIQQDIRGAKYQLVWSYILDYENSKNPFAERREQIANWRRYAKEDIVETIEIIAGARSLHERGLKKMDSLHVACAIAAGAGWFLTTDDGILKKAGLIDLIKVTDPIGFIREVRQ